MIFCTATASDRLKEAYIAIRSLRFFYPDAKIVFDGIMCDKSALKDFESIATVRCFNDPVEFFDYPLIEEISLKKSAKNHSPVSLLCASWRVFMLKDIMEQYNSPVMWFDTDVLFTKRIDDLLHSFQEFDLSLHLRGRAKNQNVKILSAVCLFNNTDKGRNFLEHYQLCYQECSSAAGWYADQRALLLALQKTTCKLLHLPSKYLSAHWTKDNPIWHLKQKKRDAVWKDEEERIKKYDLS